MTKLMKLALAAAAAPIVSAAVPAAAQVSGIAIADPNAAVAQSKAFQAAKTQIQATYKTQIDQAQARTQAIQGELQPLVTKLQADQRANVAQATLQSEYTTIQQRQQSGQQEIAGILAPAERAQQYAVEQIQAKLSDAVQNVVRARNVSLLINPQAAMFAQPAADITSAITAELDRLVPSVSTAVPANWQPGQSGAGGAAAPRAATPPTATNPRRNTSGR